MQYPTRTNRSSRQSSYKNLDVEHNEKNVATTTKCSKQEGTPLSSSRILFNRRQGITSTNMISRLKSRISLNRRQQQRITPRKKQPVINTKKRGEVVSNSNSNSNSNMNVNSDNNSPVLLSSSQTCCSTSSGSSSYSKSTSELGLQSNTLVAGSSSQQKQPPPPSPQQKKEKGQQLPRSYVDAILKVYGTPQRRSSSSSVSSSLYIAEADDVDLYRDVLQISSKASNREIQMAYIREGRSMLITTTNNDKDDGTTTSSARSTELLDDRETKLKFIALSMAHEILSTPSLKEIYDTTQRQQQSDDGGDDAVCCKTSKSDHSQSKSKEKQVSPVKVLRASSYNTTVGRDIIFGRSSSLPSSLLFSNGIARSSTGLSTLTSSSSSSSSSSIRWKDHVEEMKFIGHPNEHEKWIRKAAKSEEKEKQKQQQQQKLEKHTKTERTNTSSSSIASSSSSQCCTSIPEELESRLVSMDADAGADRLFVKDFWDTFEDSLDTVINVGGCCTNMNYLYTCSTPA